MAIQIQPFRVGRLYRIERTWLRRLAIVATCPLLFFMNFVFSVWAYAKHVTLFTLGYLLFGLFKNNGPLIASMRHYWNSSERLTD